DPLAFFDLDQGSCPGCPGCFAFCSNRIRILLDTPSVYYGRSINEHRPIHADFLSGQRDSGTKKDKRTQNQGLTAVPHSVPHWKIRRSSGTTGKKKAGKS